jgi:hypothetical protein
LVFWKEKKELIISEQSYSKKETLGFYAFGGRFVWLKLKSCDWIVVDYMILDITAELWSWWQENYS